MTGHAGSGEYGKDLVCAAASALVITFVNSVEVLCGYDLKPGVDSGYLDVLVNPDDSVQLLARGLVVGLEGIMQEHPQYIAVQHILVTDL